MRELAKNYFLVAWALSIIAGVLYAITLIGVLISVPLFIGAPKFKKAVDMTDAELVNRRKKLLGWGIFLSIVVAPTIIGIALVLAFVLIVNNHIKYIEAGKVELTERSLGEAIKDTFCAKEATSDKIKKELEEIQKLRDDGIITDEEYEAKRKKVLDID